MPAQSDAQAFVLSDVFQNESSETERSIASSKGSKWFIRLWVQF